ncbi:MAG: DegT/DnrJ/EryC1/StrS aminotransferase family protein [Spirochaetales bacterium]|nr:DegT/DnrJ/EryC1/StrS aminotransferase family protein [Spirochaetales bacterium]
MIPTFKPSILRKDMDAVLTCMVEELFETGEITKEFQKDLSKKINVSSVFGLREYRRSFELLLDTYEVKSGNRVALSPLAPWWFHMELKKRGIIPVYIDINQDSCTLRKEELETIEDKADFIFIYHHLGYENDFSLLDEVGIPVFEDISEILSSRIITENNNSGRAGIFSLQEKGYLAGLGGSFLFLRDRKDRAALKTQKEYIDSTQFVTDIQASIGASQIQRLDKYNKKRLEIREIFLASLLKSKNKTFAVDDESNHIPYSFPVILNSGSSEVFQYAKKKKIMCVNAFENSIISRFPEEVEDCPGAKALTLRCVLFPLYPSLSSADTDMIGKVLSTLP